ncbi:MAG: N-acetylmuramoyl-L-alanine amidase [Eubacteriales bacterium]|nr:N-acetylmuramoyl-L-alanine amidase [Eubacteriales bacterium]
MRHKVVIDPGHGGRDPGAVNPTTKLREKDVTLAVSRRIASHLVPAFDVVLTRSDDRDFVPQNKAWNANDDLYQRGQIINQSGASVSLSVHINSAAGPKAHGTEAFIHGSKPQDTAFGQSVLSNLVKVIGLHNRGLKTANFALVRYPKMASLLVELAFISNSKEEQLLKDPRWQDLAAQGIAQGIAEYLRVPLAGYGPPPPAGYRSLPIYAGGKAFWGVFIDGNGYMPIRAPLEALGHRVAYDGNKVEIK